jgi:inosine-uridine nucleoside N-ribohydrolase
MQKNKIIIDTDPGVDDALAIAFAIKATLQIDGICTVYGNSTVTNSSKNTLSILELVNSNIPVYEGTNKPIKGKNKLANSHGNNGLGGFYLQTNKKLNNKSALEYYQSVLSNSNKVTVVAIGPTTNIGELLIKSPKLVNKIEKIVIMGGVFNEPGNISPFAEFNVFNDPYSLELVLQSDIKEKILIPANVCRKVLFSKMVFDEIKNKKVSKGLKQITDLYINYYAKDSQYGGFEGGVMYDLLNIAYLIKPDLFTLKKERVIVETKELEKLGLTSIVSGKPNCLVINNVDSESLTKLYLEVMNK